MAILDDFAPALIAPHSLIRERFIETGLYGGHTLAVAAKQGFKKLDAIELVEELASFCRTRFADDPRVTIHSGSSPDVLAKILTDVPTTFWLDAHYTGGGVASFDPLYGECPLLEELQVIGQFRWTEKPIIVIDDAPMFGEDYWETPESKVFNRAHWPTLGEISEILCGYEIISNGQILYAVDNG